MKKLLFIGLVFTLFSVAASAQQASGESFHNRKTEEAFRDGHMNRHEMKRFHRDHQRNFRDGRMNRSERHRLHRMERHHRHHFRHNRHSRHHRNWS